MLNKLKIDTLTAIIQHNYLHFFDDCFHLGHIFILEVSDGAMLATCGTKIAKCGTISSCAVRTTLNVELSCHILFSLG